MPRTKLEVTTQVETTATVELSTRAKTMILERIEEYASLDKEIGEREERQGRIKKEIDALFAKEGQGAALVEGAALDGHRMKWVIGSQTKLDEKMLCAEFGITPAQLASCKVTTEKKPYFKLTPKGKKDRDGEDS
jgi:hypothetical protein